MVERPVWDGMLSSGRATQADTRIRQILGRAVDGGAGAFLAADTVGERYWIKPLNNGQHPRVSINEQVIGRVGALIGAPTCTVRTVAITSDVSGWRMAHGEIV